MASSIFRCFKPSFFTKRSYIALRANASAYSSCSLTKNGDICLRGSPIRGLKGRVGYRVMADQSKSGILGDFVREYRAVSSVYSPSMLGCANSPLSSARSDFRFPGKDIRETYNVSAKRMFSAKAMPNSDVAATTTSEAVLAKDGKDGGDILKPFGFKKRRQKRVKAFASQGSTESKLDNTQSGQVVNRGSINCGASAHKNAGMEKSIDVLATEGVKKANSTTCQSVFAKDGKDGGDILKPFGFKKRRWKRVKAFASQGSTESKLDNTQSGLVVNRGSINCGASAHKNAGMEKSVDVPATEGVKKANSTTCESVFAQDGKDSGDILKPFGFKKRRRKPVKAFASQGSTESKLDNTQSVQVVNRGSINCGASAHKNAGMEKSIDVLATEGVKKANSTTCESVFAKDGKDGGDILKPFGFKKRRRKHVKAFASQGSTESNPDNTHGQVVNRGSIDCGVSGHKNANMKKSIDVLSTEGAKESSSTESLPSTSTVDGEQNSNTEIKRKRRPRNRKKKEAPFDSQSSSKSVLAKTCQIDQNPNGLSQQNSLAENATKQEVDLSHAPAAAPKKKASRSRKKKKLLIEDGKEPKINDGLANPEEVVSQASSIDKSSQQPKPKPSTVNYLKPLYPPVGKSVVVVESQTKAKIIQHYLGHMYEVLPSYGHVRDLAARTGSVRPNDDFSMVWEVPSAAWTHLKSLKVAMKGAENLILASDPDCEGEAIAWHVIEMLKQQGALRRDVTVARVTFQEITESAVKSALLTPREIDANKVHAYLARRALDYLIGFNISPLLWKKLPGCQSSGRVQSAALALICEREMEIEKFNSQEYWKVDATFSSEKASIFSDCLVRSHLFRFGSSKLNQFSIGSEMEAKNIEHIVNASDFNVTGVKRNEVNKNPPSPYITSTLQQDASNKLHFTAAYTMKLAQTLYEGIEFSNGVAAGLITYPRTDGFHISDESAKEICSVITERYGLDYAASSPRKFLKKVKNAQEENEAIKPTDIRRLPSMLVGVVDEDSVKLYTLIWARTMACQMEDSKINQIQLEIGNNDGSISFRASSSKVAFPGFRSVYEDEETKAIRDMERSETESFGRDELHNILGNLKQGDRLFLRNPELKQNYTQPPPRYSEASIVRKLEELGIGRPSTYAGTIKVLQDRKCVTAKSGVLFPEFRGRVVSAFFSHYFSGVADFSSIAKMETELDNVSGGLTEWKGLLKNYWSKFSTYCDRAGKVHNHHVEEMLERAFGNALFSSLPGEDRTCPSCLEGTLTFKVSRFGAEYFIGCDQNPKCKYIAKRFYGEKEEDEEAESNTSVEEPKLLGTHPTSGEKVLLKCGAYGLYAQLGEDRYASKRSSFPKFFYQTKGVSLITLEDALDVLRYPVTLGKHHLDDKPVKITISTAGYKVYYRNSIVPVPKNISPDDLTMEKAIELLAGPNVKHIGRPTGVSRHAVDAEYD